MPSVNTQTVLTPVFQRHHIAYRFEHESQNMLLMPLDLFIEFDATHLTSIFGSDA
jgi:hypothetical protein